MKALIGLAISIAAILGVASISEAQPPAGQEYPTTADDTWQVTGLQPSRVLPWRTQVYDMVEHNGRVYVAGRFTHVRRNNGTWYWAQRTGLTTTWTDQNVNSASGYGYRVLTLSGSQRSSPRNCSPTTIRP